MTVTGKRFPTGMGTGATSVHSRRLKTEARQPLARFTRLDGGEWGIVGPPDLLVPGSVVQVLRSDGKQFSMVVGDVVDDRPRTRICAIAGNAMLETRQEPAAVPSFKQPAPFVPSVPNFRRS